MLLYDVHVLLPLLCRQLIEFLQLLYKVYSDLYFTYLEINPLGTYVHVNSSLLCAKSLEGGKHRISHQKSLMSSPLEFIKCT